MRQAGSQMDVTLCRTLTLLSNCRRSPILRESNLFLKLPPGHYTMKVRAQDFKKYRSIHAGCEDGRHGFFAAAGVVEQSIKRHNSDPSTAESST